MSGSEHTASEARNLLEFDPLPTASKDASAVRKDLDDLLSSEVPKYTDEDTSLVVFGSLARGEWTSASDLDWTYLIDGQAKPDHLVIGQKIRRILEEHKEKYSPPGQTGTFGNMAFSHDIIHQIGGQNDTNKNTTQRILLLLESRPIGKNIQAYERVVKAVINRYLEEDSHLLAIDGSRYRVPRFLLNDIVRFWRTMAVDFASKQRDRGGKGWGLRNAKLRMSRKLIFASGLLICFGCQLNPKLQQEISSDTNKTKLALVSYVHEQTMRTPLEILADAVEKYGVATSIGEQLFRAYTEFLRIIDNSESRAELDQLRAGDSGTSETFQRVREIGKSFEDALDGLFFENSQLAPVTRKYGVF